MNENTTERALKYLADTDEAHAKSKAHVKALEHVLKQVKAVEYLKSEGTVAEREAKSLASTVFADKVEEYENAWADFQIMENKRERAVLTIDVWRSLNSSRNKGNV